MIPTLDFVKGNWSIFIGSHKTQDKHLIKYDFNPKIIALRSKKSNYAKTLEN